MRVISQDGKIDVPYDCFSLSMSVGKYKDVEETYIYCRNSSSPIGTKLAEYSAESKGTKAMEMLREVYRFYNDADNGIFCFPQDNEIEV